MDSEVETYFPARFALPLQKSSMKIRVADSGSHEQELGLWKIEFSSQNVDLIVLL